MGAGRKTSTYEYDHKAAMAFNAQSFEAVGPLILNLVASKRERSDGFLKKIDRFAEAEKFGGTPRRLHLRYEFPPTTCTTCHLKCTG